MLFSVHSYNTTESEHLPVVHQVMQLIFVTCVLLSPLLPLKGSVCICEMSCPVLVGMLPDWAFSLLAALCQF